MTGVVRLATRTARATRIAATDARIPRPLRSLALFGLLPLPGPLDEFVLLLVAVPLALFYRAPLAQAWAQASRQGLDRAASE
jgi:hypothetical protein